MIEQFDFDVAFEALTGHGPFPWQQRLYHEFFAKGKIPPLCDIPTGLGKTAVIAIWLIALANGLKVPRRLVYIVNRRTVVDQATDTVMRMRERLLDPNHEDWRKHADVLRSLHDSLKKLAATDGPPLAISTLRGQFADNAEWRADPARPAVIVGTIDMVGSRLLFSGYGCGFKSRPLQAGFLGQDSLVIHDEAHLEPAFQKLLVEIETEQRQGRFPDFLPLRVVELTATSRGEPNGNGRKDADEQPFGLTDADRKHKIVNRRILARKGIRLCPIDDEKNLAETTAKRAKELAEQHPNSAILIYARKVEDVLRIVGVLEKAMCQVEQLTGTLRGLERDRLVKRPVFQRFLPPSNRDEEITPAPGTVYLVCTSAGEVGVDISADHMVCDLTPFDSMAQRLGRVNRFGEGDAMVDVVHPDAFDTEKEPDGYDARREKTLTLLKELAKREDGRRDASPQGLADLPKEKRLAAFSPSPDTLDTSDISFDAWAMTTIRDTLPGRPPAEPYLHGVEDEKSAETHIAWRSEVWLLRRAGLSDEQITSLVDDYPLKPHELLRDSTYRKKTGVRDQLAELAARVSDLPVWIQDPRGDLHQTSLGQVPSLPLAGRTVILPPQAGGLQIDSGESRGLLNGSREHAYDPANHDLYDVADVMQDSEGRPLRLHQATVNVTAPPDGMKRIAAIRLRPLADDEDEMLQEGSEPAEETFTHLQFFVQPRSADDDLSETANDKQELSPHLEKVEELARDMVRKLGLKKVEADAVVLAATWHDLGKARERWQRYVCNDQYPEKVLAKSRQTKHWHFLDGYRHEFGSLLELQFGRDGVPPDPEFRRQPPEVQDLVLHFIAAHHGYARPHFPEDRAFDPESLATHWSEASPEVPRRFARLQRKYGRWGLAYLESLLRAADWAASAAASDSGEQEDAEEKKEGRR